MIGLLVFLTALVIFIARGRDAQTLAHTVSKTRLMIIFIAILGLHVAVIGGMCVYQRLTHH